MKKLLLCLILFFTGIIVQGQTPITLIFQTKDSLTQNPIGLDSLRVKNLTENCDTTLYDSVSILNLIATWPVGIDLQEAENSELILMQNAPNPFHTSTTVKIYLKNQGELKLNVYDIQGTTLSEYSHSLGRGWHVFEISSNRSQELFLKVSKQNVTKTIKILCLKKGIDGNRISYKGQSGEFIEQRSILSTTGFNFYLGNQLQYTAYVNGYQPGTILDNPISGETYTFAMLPDVFTCGDVVTYNGQDYHTVLIGTQCWFLENLNIGNRINGSQGQSNNNLIEKYCYLDLESNCDIYGGLYQWDEAMQYVTTEGAKGVCPVGWHLPKNDEYTELSNFLGGDNLSGGKLKETGNAHWSMPNTGASNTSGFTALPGGLRDPASFSAVHLAGYFWTSTIQNLNKWYTSLGFDSALLFRFNDQNPLLGLSIRCLQD